MAELIKEGAAGFDMLVRAAGCPAVINYNGTIMVPCEFGIPPGSASVVVWLWGATAPSRILACNTLAPVVRLEPVVLPPKPTELSDGYELTGEIDIPTADQLYWSTPLHKVLAANDTFTRGADPGIYHGLRWLVRKVVKPAMPTQAELHGCSGYVEGMRLTGEYRAPRSGECYRLDRAHIQRAHHQHSDGNCQWIIVIDVSPTQAQLNGAGVADGWIITGEYRNPKYQESVCYWLDGILRVTTVTTPTELVHVGWIIRKVERPSAQQIAAVRQGAPGRVEWRCAHANELYWYDGSTPERFQRAITDHQERDGLSWVYVTISDPVVRYFIWHDPIGPYARFFVAKFSGDRCVEACNDTGREATYPAGLKSVVELPALWTEINAAMYGMWCRVLRRDGKWVKC